MVTLMMASEENCFSQLFTGRHLLPIADRLKLKTDPQVLQIKRKRTHVKEKSHASLVTVWP